MIALEITALVRKFASVMTATSVTIIQGADCISDDECISNSISTYRMSL